MHIEIDKESGFCFGVVRAITEAEQALASGEIFSLGDIVHNRIEVQRLEGLGLRTISHEQIPTVAGRRMLIRAHGEPPKTYALASLHNISLIDATCPVVAALQRKVKLAFEKILKIAVDNKISPDEMIKSLVVISDMEIDYCGDDDWTFYDRMRKLYSDNGYEIPNVIFWNVNSRSDVFHADSLRKGVQLVSGQSASTFKNLVGCIGMTPVEMMLKVINSGRYDLITIEDAKAA